MTGWREHARRGDWRLIIWEVLEDGEAENEAAHRDLLALLQVAVPIEDRVNLMERHRRHDTPAEAKMRAKAEVKRRGLTDQPAADFVDNAEAAAAMLESLMALYAEDPDWTTESGGYLRQVLAELDEQDGQSAAAGVRRARRATDSASRPQGGGAEVTIATQDEGASDMPLGTAPELDRRAHAEMGLALIEEYRILTAFAASTANTIEEREWLLDWMHKAATIGYSAGRRTQAAWGKPIEHALVQRVASQTKGHKKALNNRRELADRRNRAVVAEMDRRLAESSHYNRATKATSTAIAKRIAADFQFEGAPIGLAWNTIYTAWKKVRATGS